MTRLQQLQDLHGQSPWLDNLTRGDVTGGRLRRLASKGIRGVTSNPTIIHKAISGSADYDGQLAVLAAQGLDAEASYWSLVGDDLEGALAVLRPLYDHSGGGDGFVSVELAPALAHRTEASVAAARALHRRIAAPNLLVKIPATAEGVPAVRKATAEGQSINVTLLFGLDRYDQIIEAYLSGLEAHDGDLARVHGVASFFVSRVDSEVDRRLETIGTPKPSSCAARRRWPRPSWPTSCSGTASAAPAGRRWPPGAPGSSGHCGRRPRPRTPPTPTPSTSTA